MQKTKIGVIGGSGIYNIDGIENTKWQNVETPWGTPSDEIFTGKLHGIEIVFLPRHGRGHILAPSEIPYRANIDAMKRLGVTDLISISACGSFRDNMEPGHFVVVDQFIDRTTARENSFFGTGCVAHVSVANPTCLRLSAACSDTAKDQGITIHFGGTYLAMEGPQFSTLAESRLYRDIWGCDVIGMTNMPEAKLAREAELCYASVAMITDYDSWHPEYGEVDVAKIIKILTENSTKARGLITNLTDHLKPERPSCTQNCGSALDSAIITAPEARDPSLIAKLDAVAGRVL